MCFAVSSGAGLAAQVFAPSLDWERSSTHPRVLKHTCPRELFAVSSTHGDKATWRKLQFAQILCGVMMKGAAQTSRVRTKCLRRFDMCFVLRRVGNTQHTTVCSQEKRQYRVFVWGYECRILECTCCFVMFMPPTVIRYFTSSSLFCTAVPAQLYTLRAIVHLRCSG